MTRRSVICPSYIRSLNALLYKYDYKKISTINQGNKEGKERRAKDNEISGL